MTGVLLRRVSGSGLSLSDFMDWNEQTITLLGTAAGLGCAESLAFLGFNTSSAIHFPLLPPSLRQTHKARFVTIPGYLTLSLLGSMPRCMKPTTFKPTERGRLPRLPGLNKDDIEQSEATAFVVRMESAIREPSSGSCVVHSMYPPRMWVSGLGKGSSSSVSMWRMLGCPIARTIPHNNCRVPAAQLPALTNLPASL